MEFDEQPMILRLWQHRVVRKSVDSLSREGSSPSTDTIDFLAQVHGE